MAYAMRVTGQGEGIHISQSVAIAAEMPLLLLPLHPYSEGQGKMGKRLQLLGHPSGDLGQQWQRSFSVVYSFGCSVVG